MSHGLTSLLAREQMREDVDHLALALLGSSPATPRLLEAARAAAEDILHWRRVQRHRRFGREADAVSRLPDAERHREFYLTLTSVAKLASVEDYERTRSELRARRREDADGKSNASAEGWMALLHVRRDYGREFERLAEYERRAYSRVRKSVRRLDYERIEAERGRDE